MIAIACSKRSEASATRDRAVDTLINSWVADRCSEDSMPTQVSTAPEISLKEFQEARKVVSTFARHTPLLTSRILSERTGFDVRLKAEMFQKGGSYKIRGPLNKFTCLTDAQKRSGLVCSSARHPAQGVALAANLSRMHAVVVMARKPNPSHA